VGGDFKHIPACRRPRQTGCVIAFSTFDQQPPEDAIFGRTTEPGREVLCTNPAALRGGTARLHPVWPSRPFAPGSTIAAAIAVLGFPLPEPPTPWIAVPGSFSAHCSGAGGAHVLRVLARGGAPTLSPSPDPTWGLHLTDGNIALGDLGDLVGKQAAAYERRRR
jgi:hypothetical protein